MRDSSRISKILAKIHEKWSENPDLRLMQLLVNAIRPETPCPQVYYLEDDILMEKLDLK